MGTKVAVAIPEQQIDGLPLRRIGRDFVILLSLVNVAYLRIWSELLTLKPSDLFWKQRFFTAADYLAPILGITIMAAVLTAAAYFVRTKLSGWPQRLGFVGFLVLTLIPALEVRDVLVAYFPGTFNFLRAPVYWVIDTWSGRIVMLAVACVAAYIVLRWPTKVVHSVAGIFVICAPFTVMTFGNALFKSVTEKPPQSVFSTASFLPVAQGSPHVLWFIMDEWDYRLTFVDRPQGLSLPAVDRLSKEVLYADNALPPEWYTGLSMPSFVDGRRVAKAAPASNTTYLLTYEKSSRQVPWGSRPNVFSDARKAGFNTAVVGWYVPYCKVLDPVLNSCWTFPMEMQSNTTGDTFPEKLINQARSIFETRTVSPFGQSLCTEQKVKDYEAIMQQVRSTIVDQRLGLSLIHLPVPHSPHAYDRRTGTFTLKNRPITGYVDSLALVDVTIADIRKTLENAGLWDRSVLVFSADHPFRSAAYLDGKMDTRIPFLVKFAGQNEQVVYQKKFDTVITGSLLMAVLRGEVKDAAQATQWIDAHRTTDAPEATTIQAQ